MAYTSSFQTNVTSDGQDKFMRCKSGVAVRKFNDTMWPSGSWHEAWIAFSIKMDLPFPWTKTTSTRASSGAGQMMIGLCRTDGPVYGEISASSDTTNQHFIGMYFDNTFPADATTAGYTGSYAYGSFSGFPRIYATGSYQGTFSFSNMFIPFTSGSEDRTLFAMRFVTGSGNLWNVKACYPSGINAFTNPITSSTQVALFLSQSAWGSYTPDGYYYTPVGSDLTVNRSANGYFDGIFIGWQQWFEELHVSDVVVRLL
jgi:hypothetical protein